jgi:LPXTG-site transpeptidase (sortase) family protein
MPNTKRLKKYAKVFIQSPLPYTVVALLCFAVYGFWISSLIVETHANSRPRSVVVENKSAEVRDVPSTIVIPNYSITLPIEQSQINGQNWEISATGASHLVDSAIPGENSTIIMYGHNKKELFGQVKKIKLNEEIHIVSKSGKISKYKVVRTRTVKADDVDALGQISGETLVFYTCAGFADTKRFLIFAKPI